MQVLVALDLQHPSEALLALAVRAVQRLGADVHLLTVVPSRADHATYVASWSASSAAARPAADTSGGLIPYPTPLSPPAGAIVETRTQAAVRTLDEAHDRLAGLTQHFGDHAVTIAVEAAEQPAAAITAYARQHQVDLVIMGTHGRGGMRRVVLGSVAEGVVRELTIPVLLAGPRMALSHATGWTTLIVCVDGSPFAEAILPIASFVRRLGLRVVLVSVTPMHPAPAPPADVQEDNYIHGLAKELRRQGVDAQWDILHGNDPAHTISQYAAGWPGSIIALATHARRGLPRIFAGSVAMRIVGESNDPVLVVHPRTLLPDGVAANAPRTAGRDGASEDSR